MTLGDILAALAVVFIVGASWAATILLAALGLPSVVARAGTRLTASPGRCAALGAAALLIGILIAGALWKGGAGPGRLLSALLLGGLGMMAAVGSAAATKLLAGRIDALGSPLSPFGSLTRASVLYVSVGFLPVLGWFFLVPAALLLSVGCGLAALRGPKKARLAVPAFEAVSSLETAA